jgi:hypothetical protein
VSELLIRRDDLRTCRVVDSSAPSIGDGEALLRIDTFGLTANNVTYAVMGEAMSYWDFFPAEAGWGRLPVWGFAEVAESAREGLEEGLRVYGYLPAAAQLVVRPEKVDERGFVDASPHRAALPSAYNGYLATGSDPFHRPDTEALQMLLRPLFFTSFLLDDQLDDDGLATDGPILFSIASSKTALAAAFLLSRRDDVEVVGLTSPGRVEFVESLGVYARVLAYDSVGSLERSSASYVDFSGDAFLRAGVHARLGEELRASIAVGVTHWEEFGAADKALPGPRPTLFFAPDRVTKRSRDWGRDALEHRVAEAWEPFCEWAAGWLEAVPGHGFEAARAAYLEVLEGRVDPQRAHVLTV